MRKGNGRGTAFLTFVLVSFLLLTVLLGTGCEKADTSGGEAEEEMEEDNAEDGRDAEEEVSLTLYFRLYIEGEEYLAPEERTVYTADAPLAAMEELIKGPGEGSELMPVLPGTTQVLDVSVEDGVCTVDVSKEIITDSSEVGFGARGEVLALATIADTLTGLEGIEEVRLLVEGKQSGEVDGRHIEDFWGHTGLPETLERDESLIYR
ncbi:MAG: GerMN domain-containing protein [Actinomycetota bacterium]|nr:GerMN domain-containing protein [Actinomycetota bacterium]